MQGQDFVWARQMGGASSEWGWGVAVDDSGNVYTTGEFQGTVDFDPGAGVFNLTSAGGDDIFVSKLDSAGNFVWAQQLGRASGGTHAASVAVDGRRKRSLVWLRTPIEYFFQEGSRAATSISWARKRSGS